MQKRFEELDLLRGLAIVAMVVYHLLFILNFFGVYGVNLEFSAMQIFAWIVRFDFLALVGVGMVISYYRIRARGFGKVRATLQQWKRGLVVGGCGMVVTVATYFYIPDNFVRFGILHLIAVSIFFWSFFVERKWLVFALSLISFWLGGWFAWVGLSAMDFTNVFMGYFLRDMLWEIQAVDYFPLFPWVGMVGMGIFLGHVFYPKGVKRFEAKELVKGDDGLNISRWSMRKYMCLLGRHSLAVYMIHIPVIMVVLWVFGLVKI